MESMNAHADQIESQGTRRFTIDAAAIFGPVRRESELRITLPAGWNAQLPHDVHATSVFGEFHSEYTQQGRDLMVHRSISGGRGVFAPDRISELVTWIRAMGKEDTRFIVLAPADNNPAK